MNAAAPYSQLRANARGLFDRGLRAVDPSVLMPRFISLDADRYLTLKTTNGGAFWNLQQIDHIYVTGAGKSSAFMAEALEAILGEHISEGIIVTKYGFGTNVRRVDILEAGHPVPDQNGLGGAVKIIDLLERATERDLIINLVSGGASALLPLPASGVSLEDKQRVTEILLRSGASIDEMNTVRKHLSRIKGGQFARRAHPATVISLILSDVVNDRLDTIGSGLTVPDTTTFAEACHVLRKYDLVDVAPKSVRTMLSRGVNGELPETPKPGDGVFANVTNAIIGNNQIALEEIQVYAMELGYATSIVDTEVHGEARNVAREHIELVRTVLSGSDPTRLPACLIAGGETTVTVNGSGTGGRNQEYCLAAAIELVGINNVVVLSGGTDGNDGPTHAAGGIIDGTTVLRARQLGLDAKQYLHENDSHTFLHQTNDLLITGPTTTNVMDIQIILIDKPGGSRSN